MDLSPRNRFAERLAHWAADDEWAREAPGPVLVAVPVGVDVVVGLALDFWTWRRLTTEGISDDVAAALMVGAATAAAELDEATHRKRPSRSLP